MRYHELNDDTTSSQWEIRAANEQRSAAEHETCTCESDEAAYWRMQERSARAESQRRDAGGRFCGGYLPSEWE